MPAEALEWPLVGREEELARIDGLRGTAGAPGVVIVAPAGVGKSSLARHAVAAAQRDGAFTGWVQATRSAATIPLGALAALLPDDGTYGGPLELMRGAAVALRARAAGRPVVLGDRRRATAGPGLGGDGPAPGDERDGVRRRHRALGRAAA